MSSRFPFRRRPLRSVPRHRPNRVAGAAIGLAAISLALAAGCSPSTEPKPTGTPSTNPAACGLRGAPADVTTLCLDTKNSSTAAKGELTELYRPSPELDGEALQFDSATLAQDGSIVAYTVPSAITDEGDEPTPGHPRIGMVTASGFTPFERDLAASDAYAIAGTARAGDSVAWLEEASSSDSVDGAPWVAYAATRSAVTQVAERSAMPAAIKALPLDGDDPGPAIAGKTMRWRVGLSEVEAGDMATPGAVGPVLLTAPLTGGKVTQSDLDQGLANRDAAGRHYFLADTGEETSYQIIAQDEDGKETVVYADSKAESDMVDNPRVVDGTVIWAVQSSPPATDDGLTDGDAGTADGDGATAVPDGAEAGPTDAETLPDGAPSAEPGGTDGQIEGTSALFAYTPDAKRLVRIQTSDATVGVDVMSVAGDRVAWAGYSDPKEYVADLSALTITSVASCAQCGQVALAPNGTLFWMTPPESVNSAAQPVVGRLQK